MQNPLLPPITSEKPASPKEEYSHGPEEIDESNNSRRTYGKLTLFFAGPTTAMGVIIGGIAKGLGHTAGHLVGGAVGLASAPILAGITWLATKPKPDPSLEQSPSPGVKRPELRG